jgi:hypothetical protein
MIPRYASIVLDRDPALCRIARELFVEYDNFVELIALFRTWIRSDPTVLWIWIDFNLDPDLDAAF